MPERERCTSASRPCISPPATLTKFQTIEAICKMPPTSPELPTTSSEVLEAAFPAGESLVAICGRERDMPPVVVRMAPLARSSMIVARTPDFFESRPRGSSKWSGVPLVAYICHKYFHSNITSRGGKFTLLRLSAIANSS